MDHPTLTAIEQTGYPKGIFNINEDEAERSCDICETPFSVVVKGIKYCYRCAKDAGVLRTNSDPFYPDYLFKEDQNDSD